MTKAQFRARIREIHEGQEGRPYSRAFLAEQLELDPKTSNRYIDEYEVGWPPFAREDDGWLVWTVSVQNGRLLHVNDRLCEVLEYDRLNILGLGSHQVFRPGENLFETEPELVELADQVRQGRLEKAEFATWLRAADGRRIDLRAEMTWDPTLEAYLISGQIVR